MDDIPNPSRVGLGQILCPLHHLTKKRNNLIDFTTYGSVGDMCIGFLTG